MDPSAIHVFIVIAALAGPPVSVDIFELDGQIRTFDSMEDCREYVMTHPDDIKKSMEEMRPFLSIPDGVPFEAAYGCRGKKKQTI